MSQVIITQDSFALKRKQTRNQENDIPRGSGLPELMLSNISERSLLVKLATLAVMPLLGVWFLLGVVLSVVMVFLTQVFGLFKGHQAR